MALIWVAPLVSFSFALLWIPGTTTFIKSQGSSLLTGVIWMITPQAVQALNGFSMHKPYFKNFLMRVLSSFHITVTPLNLYPHLLTKLPVFYPASPSPMASPLRAALPPILRPSYLRICSGSRCIILHSSLLSFSPYITCQEYPHFLPYLHTATCKCKCKTFLLPNFALSSSHLSLLDSTPWGCKIISPSATMLGLFLHSPYSKPTPLYDDQMSLLPPSPPFTRSAIEAAQLRKPIATMQKRTRASLPWD